MNKAITEGLALMPPPFSAGLNLWSREDGLTGQGSYASQPNAAYVPSDQDFAGCLELTKTSTTQKLRCFQSIPFQPGLYLRVTAKVKAMSGALPAVRIAGWAGNTGGTNVTSAVQVGPSVQLTTYGEVVTVQAIIASSNRQGVDMDWGTTPVLGHFGLDLTGSNGGAVRIDDIVIEDVSDIFFSVMFNWVDVRDYGAVGDGVTNDLAAFQAADNAAAGKVVLVSPGNYYLSGSLTIDNPVQFEGTVTMPAAARLICVRDFNLDAYTSAFGTELLGFTKALQALFYTADNVELDLSGRRVELTAPIDVAALAGLTDFSQRRLIRNGQLAAISGTAWTTTTVTSNATYSTTQTAKLTAVANVNNIPIGARVSGPGVGREVYVVAKNTTAGTVDLSHALYGGSGSHSYTFDRYRYMLDFSGFNSLSKFEIADIEMIAGGYCSCIMLALDGDSFRLADSVLNKPKDRGVTSIGSGCQNLNLNRCDFISNEASVPSQNRVSIVFNVNANDSKIRLNRSNRFGTFGVLSGSGHMFVGNHFFGGDDETLGSRKAGIVLTQPNVKTLVTGNYIDNCWIEMSNEHDNVPNLTDTFTFGGLTVSGNIFTANSVASWFRWIKVAPKGTGHWIEGLTVANNAFRSINGNIDRIEEVDTTNAVLNPQSFRNITFTGNTFNNVDQETVSPLYIQHTQNTESATWTVDGAAYMPFLGRARNVMGLVLEGPVTNASNANQFVMPYVLVEQGTGGTQVALKWPSAVKGVAQVTLRVDNPL
jgi:Pectate lyase superfamily protein